MTSQANQTKQRILEIACTLFAKHGYNSVTARMIAEEAGIRNGTIYYHFKSKEALYIEVFRWMYDFDLMLTHDVLLDRDPNILQTPNGQSHAIHLLVGDFFHRHLHPERRWQRRLVLQEVLENSPVFRRILNEIFSVELNKMMEFYYLLNPTGSSVDAYLWSHLPSTQVLDHMVWEKILENDHDPDFVAELKQKVIKITALSMITILDLPVPDVLKE